MDNHIVLVGKMARDPELRHVGATSTPTVRFTLTVYRSWMNKQTREKKDEIAHYEVVAFGDLAVNLCESTQRDDTIIVTGKLAQRVFDNNGHPLTVIEVLAQHIGIDLLSQSVPLDEESVV